MNYYATNEGTVISLKMPNRVRYNVNYVKLYVTSVPRTATEQDIRPLFEQYGNVVEVILLKDKNTGQQQGSCLVKYATALDADNAVAALNKNYTFPGEMGPVTVKYATKQEKERSGMPEQTKVYVGMINREASTEELTNIFSPFGEIEDVYILLDDMKQSRGCGFIKFSQIEMARAAIEGLHGIYTMRGCDSPLVVRIAEPKKPKPGEFSSWSNSVYSGTNFGPDYREWGSRQTNTPGDYMWGYNQPNAPYFEQHISSTSQPQTTPSAANQDPPPCYMMPLQQMHSSETMFQSSQQTAPDQLQVHLISKIEMVEQRQLSQTSGQQYRMPLPQLNSSETSSQSSQQTAPDMQQPAHSASESSIVEQKQLCQTSGQQPSPSGSSSQAVFSKFTLPAMPLKSRTPQFPECDWSEHTCPDGYKYYYNCDSCESLWEKPKEFALFEEQLNKQRQQQNPCTQISPPSPVLSPPSLTQTLDTEKQNEQNPCNHTHPQSPVLSTMSLTRSLDDEKQNKQNPCTQINPPSPVLSTPSLTQPLEDEKQNTQSPCTQINPPSPVLSTPNLTQPLDDEKQNKQSPYTQINPPSLVLSTPNLTQPLDNEKQNKQNPCTQINPPSPVLSTSSLAQPLDDEKQNEQNPCTQINPPLPVLSAPSLSRPLDDEKQNIDYPCTQINPPSPVLSTPSLTQPEDNEKQNEQNPCTQINPPSPVLSTPSLTQPLDDEKQDKQYPCTQIKPPSPVLSIRSLTQPLDDEEQNKHSPSNHIHPPSPVLSTPSLTQPLNDEKQNNVPHEKLQLEEPSMLLPDQVEVQ